MNRQVSLGKHTLSTIKFEQRCEQIKQDIQRYREVENSPELQEFKDLQAIVEQKAFQDKKHYLLTRKYRDTEECKQLKRYRTLRYFSIQVLRYRRFRNDQTQCDYLAFADSEDYAQLRDKEAVKTSPVLRRYKKIDGSFRLKNYRTCERSKAVRDYLTLIAEIETEDFQTRQAFWANPKRWYTTEESKQDERYMELKKSEDIQFYLSRDAKQIAEWESYKTLFQDEFDQSNVKNSAWKAGFYYANPNLKTDHSYANEQQAYNHGNNTYASGSILTIETRRETATAAAWHPTKGFIPKEYAWTSDIMQTAATFQAKEGLFLAKVRVSGQANAALYLASGERLPIVKLMQWKDKKVWAGMRTAKEDVQVSLQGVAANSWMIYGVEITAKEIVWYINDQEILRTPNTLQGASLYPAIAEYLPEGITAGPGKIEVDWIRVYKK